MSAISQRKIGLGGVLALCGVQLLDTIDANIVVVALPRIGSDLDFSAAALTWVVTGYVVMFGSLMIVAGRVAERLGPRRILMVGGLLFAASSCLCALAQSPDPLLMGRLLQGIGAAMMSGTALTLLVRYVPGERRAKALALWTSSAAVGGIASLLLGGVIVDGLGWRWIFWINLPICVIGALGLLRWVPPDSETRRTGWTGIRSAGTIALTIVALIAGLSLVSEPGVAQTAGIVLTAVSLPLLPLVLWLDARDAEPVLDRRLRRDRDFVTGVMVTLLGAASVPPAVVIVSMVLQFAGYQSPTAVGLLILPFSVFVVVGAELGSRWLATRRGDQVLPVFGAVCALALGLLALALGSGEVWPFPLLTGLLGLGFGAVAVTANTIAFRSVPPHLNSAVGPVVNTTTQIATAAGIAAFVTAPIAASGATSAASISAADTPYLQAATAATAVCALGLVALSLRNRSVRWRRRYRPQRRASERCGCSGR